MEKKVNKTLLPAALVCFGVESLSASINADETKNLNPYEAGLIKANVEDRQVLPKKESFKSRQEEIKRNEKLYKRENSNPTIVKEKRKNPLKKTQIATEEIEKQKEIALKKIKSQNKINKTKKEKLASEILKQKTTITIKKTQKKLTKVTNEANKTITKIKRRSKAIVKLASKKLQKNIAPKENKTKIVKVKRVLQKRQKINNKVTLTKFKKPKEIKQFRKKIHVIATAYTSHPGQTDKTPFLAAWNNKIKPGMKIIAVSRDLIKKYGLTNGKKVKIQGLPGVYTVRDKMNKRFRSRIDIYMGLNKKKALQWGKRKIVLYIQ